LAPRAEANFLLLARQKRDNTRVAFDNRDHALFQDDILDELAIFLHRVEHRQERELPKGR
jgi:hypothetical protein